jgi:hypothetical protein
VIVADFPALFAEFGGNRLTLLWRGSRDGFRARAFHRRCDGHAPTLTLIQDTEGNIFGGFTPGERESRTYNREASRALGRSNGYKADPSLRSFPFTMKNPHNFSARKFALKAEICGPQAGELSPRQAVTVGHGIEFKGDWLRSTAYGAWFCRHPGRGEREGRTGVARLMRGDSRTWNKRQER